MLKRSRLLILIYWSCAVSVHCGNSDMTDAPPKLKSDVDKTLYALGRITGRSLSRYGFSPRELALVQLGIADQALGHETVVDVEHFAARISALAPARSSEEVQAEKQKAKAFEAEAAQQPGAIREASGVIFRALREGQGAAPNPDDVLTLNYEGRFVDGKVFTTSNHPGAQTEFHGDNLIRCWADALHRMHVGGKARLVCPSATAYGDLGRPPKIPGGATLVFDVELVGARSPAAH